MNSKGRRQIKRIIKSFAAHGGMSCLAFALNKAISDVSDSKKPATIFLITNEKDTCGGDLSTRAWQAWTAGEHGIRLVVFSTNRRASRRREIPRTPPPSSSKKKRRILRFRIRREASKRFEDILRKSPIWVITPHHLREFRRLRRDFAIQSAPHIMAPAMFRTVPTVNRKPQKTARIYRKRRGSNYTRHIPERFHVTQ